MSTQAQVTANPANAQHSCDPKTEEGKAASSQNNFRHGFTGSFKVLPWEKQEDFREVLVRLCTLHQPQNEGEIMLVEKMAQHYWLAQRALTLQDQCFNTEQPLVEQEKQLALYLRYQTTHDRAFYKCADELRKHRNETRKAEIGFESHQLKLAAEVREQSKEKRKQELHSWAVLLAEAEAEHRFFLNARLETPGMERTDRVERVLAAERAA